MNIDNIKLPRHPVKGDTITIEGVGTFVFDIKRFLWVGNRYYIFPEMMSGY